MQMGIKPHESKAFLVTFLFTVFVKRLIWTKVGRGHRVSQTVLIFLCFLLTLFSLCSFISLDMSLGKSRIFEKSGHWEESFKETSLTETK